MKELDGTPLDKFPFTDLFKVGDLVNYEGPLLSLFSNNRGDLYLYDWSDSDEQYNRWLVYRITLNQLVRYLNKNLSHYQLISTYFDDFIISVDIDDEMNFHNMNALNVHDIPVDYFPDKNVLHDDEECPHLNEIKLHIRTLESKEKEARKKVWDTKYHLSYPFEQIIAGMNKIANRGQLLPI